MKYPLSIASEIRTNDTCELNKGYSSKFWKGYWAWQQTPEEGQCVQCPKCDEIKQNEHADLNENLIIPHLKDSEGKKNQL